MKKKIVRGKSRQIKNKNNQSDMNKNKKKKLKNIRKCNKEKLVKKMKNKKFNYLIFKV